MVWAYQEQGIPVRNVTGLTIQRGRGRPRSKKNWNEVMILDLTCLQLIEDMTWDRIWISRIRVVDLR